MLFLLPPELCPSIVGFVRRSEYLRAFFGLSERVSFLFFLSLFFFDVTTMTEDGQALLRKETIHVSINNLKG